MMERNNGYRKKTKEIFRSLELQSKIYRGARTRFNELVGNPPDKENSFSEIAGLTGSYSWFIEWKFGKYLNDHGGKESSFIVSPVMFAKYKLYIYSAKKIESNGPYYSRCFKSPKIPVR